MSPGRRRLFRGWPVRRTGRYAVAHARLADRVADRGEVALPRARPGSSISRLCAMTTFAARTIAALRAEHDASPPAPRPDPISSPGRRAPPSGRSPRCCPHLGSGAEITLAGLQAALGQREAPGADFNPSVWDRWDAMEPESSAPASGDTTPRSSRPSRRWTPTSGNPARPRRVRAAAAGPRRVRRHATARGGPARLGRPGRIGPGRRPRPETRRGARSSCSAASSASSSASSASPTSSTSRSSSTSAARLRPRRSTTVTLHHGAGHAPPRLRRALEAAVRHDRRPAAPEHTPAGSGCPATSPSTSCARCSPASDQGLRATPQ